MMNFPLAMGIAIASVGAEDVREYLLARGVTEEDIEVFYNSAVKVAGAFYREPK